ncbi:11946_t:CDS:2, partial [Ambispora leptoticha]
GDLRCYLNDHFSKLDWPTKIRMAKEISSGIDCLHSANIVHSDLHDKNILVNDGRMIITDFGLSKLLDNSTKSITGGTCAYSDPQYLQSPFMYRRNKPSDIYSLGVLFWELSSGIPPFKALKDLMEVTLHVIKGNRETPTEGTPIDFKNLYCAAWSVEPDSRPDIKEICNKLDHMRLEPVYQNINMNTLNYKYKDTNVDPTPSLSAVPFSKFTKINDIINITEEITPIYQSAEHNKRISKSLSERIVAIETSLRLLKAYKDEHREFFNKQNFVSIQKLSDIIQKMKTFISEITQLKGLRKYCQTKSIQTIFYELTTEFDRCINTLNFINTDNIKSRTEHEKEIIDNDLEELNQYLFKIGGGITDENYNISETINEINLVKKFIWDSRSNRENREQIMEIIEDQNKLLELADFIETDEIRGKKVRKYIRLVDNKAVAFKFVSDESDTINVQNEIRKHVAILMKLKDCHQIIQFHGLISDDEDEKLYLVTEWAERGNLREFYMNYRYGGPIDVRKKLSIAVDIARGLNFLLAVEINIQILHQDIRPENILITANKTAKIANFLFRRYVRTVRYAAPEMLYGYNNKYNTKCEVYSFGILLWELAEQRIPYEDLDDIMAIKDRVYKEKYREPFTNYSGLPKEYKDISRKAVGADPEFRPTLTEMFKTLQNLLEPSNTPNFSSKIPYKINDISPISHIYNNENNFQDDKIHVAETINFAEFNYMTMKEAISTHRATNGNLEMAFKCFNAYAKLGNLIAKYFVGYYLYKKLINTPYTEEERERRAAQLFKEVADASDEVPDAQLKYVLCLFNGMGVDKNYSEAAKYFKKAADNGLVVGIYNFGNILYAGLTGVKDEEL